MILVENIPKADKTIIRENLNDFYKLFNSLYDGLDAMRDFSVLIEKESHEIDYPTSSQVARKGVEPDPGTFGSWPHILFATNLFLGPDLQSVAGDDLDTIRLILRLVRLFEKVEKELDKFAIHSKSLLLPIPTG